MFPNLGNFTNSDVHLSDVCNFLFRSLRLRFWLLLLLLLLLFWLLFLLGWLTHLGGLGCFRLFGSIWLIGLARGLLLGLLLILGRRSCIRFLFILCFLSSLNLGKFFQLSLGRRLGGLIRERCKQAFSLNLG